MDLTQFSLVDSDRGDSVPRSDGTRGSALSDTLKLGGVAVAVKFAIGAAGNFTYVNRAGRTRTVAVGTDYATGVWHLIQIQQVRATGTTLAATAFELGWSW